MRPVHVVIPTHTTRHLRLTLLGIACQSTMPASVTVSCDNNDDEIRDHLADIAAEFGFPITLVRREHQGRERLAQVRNNAVRALTGRAIVWDKTPHQAHPTKFDAEELFA